MIYGIWTFCAALSLLCLADKLPDIKNHQAEGIRLDAFF